MSEVTWVDIAGLIISALTMLSIVFAVTQIVAQTRQMHRDFEALYVERYWALMDRRSGEFERGGKPRKEDRLVIHQYLQLCEDEIDLRVEGRVTNDTWGFWERSIRAQATDPRYLAALRSSAAHEYPSLKALLRTKEAYDPLHWKASRRWWKGL